MATDTEQRVEQIDPVTLSVINNAFVNVCREMGTAMMRTSYSPIFNEGLDFSCMMFNLRGDLIGQAEFCPTMLGSCQYAMKWMLDEVGLDAFGPGDVFIHNDPYRGQCHMPEHLVVKAVFHEDPGGSSATSPTSERSAAWPPAPSPPMPPRSIRRAAPAAPEDHGRRRVREGHLADRPGQPSHPEDHLGRLSRHDRFAARRRGAGAGAAGKVRREYSPTLPISCSITRSASCGPRSPRCRTASITRKDCMEDDGVTRPYWMRLRLTIRGDEAICDWTDSDEQAKGPINATFVVTAASCYSGFLHVVSDDIPINSGCYRPIRLVTRPGTLVNVKHPGPSVGGNTRPTRISRTSSGRWPGRCRQVAAAEGVLVQLPVRWFHPEYGDYYELSHRGSGWGGTVDHDGNSVLCPNNGNCRNTPVEILETKYPFIVEEYRLRPTRREQAAGAVDWPAPASASTRRRSPSTPSSTAPDHGPGIFGGQAGASSGIFIQRPGDDRFRRFSETFGTVSDSKFTRVVTEGDRIQLESAGGGGSAIRATAAGARRGGCQQGVSAEMACSTATTFGTRSS